MLLVRGGLLSLLLVWGQARGCVLLLVLLCMWFRSSIIFFVVTVVVIVTPLVQAILVTIHIVTITTILDTRIVLLRRGRGSAIGSRGGRLGRWRSTWAKATCRWVGHGVWSMPCRCRGGLRFSHRMSGQFYFCSRTHALVRGRIGDLMAII